MAVPAKWTVYPMSVLPRYSTAQAQSENQDIIQLDLQLADAAESQKQTGQSGFATLHHIPKHIQGKGRKEQGTDPKGAVNVLVEE